MRAKSGAISSKNGRPPAGAYAITRLRSPSPLTCSTSSTASGGQSRVFTRPGSGALAMMAIAGRTPARTLASPVTLVMTRPPPAPAILLDEVGARGGTIRTCRVVRKIARRQRLPHVEDRRRDAPGRLHHVGAMEQRAVADHAVVEQPLVAGGGARLAEVLVAEVELDRVELDRRPRALRLDQDLDRVLGLD